MMDKDSRNEEKEKRAVIYASERLKTIGAEIKFAKEEYSTLRAESNLSEAQRRKSVYLSTHLKKLEIEKQSFLDLLQDYRGRMQE